MNKQIIEKGLRLIDQISIEIGIEIWKPVDGYDNYEVSSHGNIRNVKTGKSLKPSIKEGYHVVNLYNNGRGKTFHIHRLVASAFILNPENKKCVDHINNTRTDNNVKNIRFATYKENGQNSSLSVKNTSSVKGVYKRNKQWQARIVVDGKYHHLGYFKTLEEAKVVRQLKSAELYGEFQNKCEK